MDFSVLIIIANLILLEGLLSIDNAAVLAVMVSHLPEKQRKKALTYGLLGAYVFRLICLLIAKWLIQIIWLKAVGGLYLIYLSIKGLRGKSDSKHPDTSKSGLFKTFWGTVAMVEIMDIAFSIDNIFAAVAMSDKMWVIVTGVFIGILVMRFVAQKFVTLMEKYPSLAGSAYIVIGILGWKLVASAMIHYFPGEYGKNLEAIMETHTFDLIFSIALMGIFLAPLLQKKKRLEKDLFI